MPRLWDLVKSNSSLESGTFWQHLNNQRMGAVYLIEDVSADISQDLQASIPEGLTAVISTDLTAFVEPHLTAEIASESLTAIIYE